MGGRSRTEAGRAAGVALAAALVLVLASFGSAGAVAAPGAATLAQLAGTRFADPEGDYRMTIPSSGWQAAHGSLVAGIEVWFVAPRAGGFTPNVNVLTQTVPAGTTLEAYLKASIANGPRVVGGLASIRSTVVRGASARLAVWDYRSRQAGRNLRHVGVFGISGTRAVVATLTAPVGTFDALRRVTMPYLLTLTPLRRG